MGAEAGSQVRQSPCGLSSLVLGSKDSDFVTVHTAAVGSAGSSSVRGNGWGRSCLGLPGWCSCTCLLAGRTGRLGLAGTAKPGPLQVAAPAEKLDILQALSAPRAHSVVPRPYQLKQSRAGPGGGAASEHRSQQPGFLGASWRPTTTVPLSSRKGVTDHWDGEATGCIAVWNECAVPTQSLWEEVLALDKGCELGTKLTFTCAIIQPHQRGGVWQPLLGGG